MLPSVLENSIFRNRLEFIALVGDYRLLICKVDCQHEVASLLTSITSLVATNVCENAICMLITAPILRKAFPNILVFTDTELRVSLRTEDARDINGHLHGRRLKIELIPSSNKKPQFWN
jgi:hypothetical protein